MIHFVEKLEDDAQVIHALNTGQAGKIVSVRQKYYIAFSTLSKSGNITSDCAEITLYNGGSLPLTGLSNCSINGVPLVPGASLVVNGNEGEQCTTVFNATFDNTGINALIIIRKFYTS